MSAVFSDDELIPEGRSRRRCCCWGMGQSISVETGVSMKMTLRLSVIHLVSGL